MTRWKPTLNAFAIALEGRISPTDQDNADNRLHRKTGSPALG